MYALCFSPLRKLMDLNNAKLESRVYGRYLYHQMNHLGAESSGRCYIKVGAHGYGNLFYKFLIGWV